MFFFHIFAALLDWKRYAGFEPAQKQLSVATLGPSYLICLQWSLSYASTGTRGQETTTESYSHSFYFNYLTVIKDSSYGDCQTKNGPTLHLGEQTFQTRPPKLQMNPKNSYGNFSGFLFCGFFTHFTTLRNEEDQQVRATVCMHI